MTSVKNSIKQPEMNIIREKYYEYNRIKMLEKTTGCLFEMQ